MNALIVPPALHIQFTKSELHRLNLHFFDQTAEKLSKLLKQCDPRNATEEI